MNSTQFIWNMQKRDILYNIIKNRIENNELRGELIMSAYLLILMGDINHSGCVIMQPEMMRNFICIVTKADSNLDFPMSEFTLAPFYWEPEDGYLIYKKLDEAASNENLPTELRRVAVTLMTEGRSPRNGYILKMNAYYMKHFIDIITDTLLL